MRSAFKLPKYSNQTCGERKLFCVDSLLGWVGWHQEGTTSPVGLGAFDICIFKFKNRFKNSVICHYSYSIILAFCRTVLCTVLLSTLPFPPVTRCAAPRARLRIIQVIQETSCTGSRHRQQKATPIAAQRATYFSSLKSLHLLDTVNVSLGIA